MFKIGIVGTNFGTIGLLPAFKHVKDCEVIMLSKDWKHALENNVVNAVAIATPPDTQYQIAKLAISKGMHVFAEKPLTANIKQARELVSLAKKKKVTTCVDFIFPEITEWQNVKKLLTSEKFGKLKHISVDWDWLSGDIQHGKKTWKTDTKKGGGALSFYFSHGFHYLEYFAGKILNVKSIFKYAKESLNGGEVGIDMLIKFQNNISGSAHVSCKTEGVIRHNLIFQCEKGIITLENSNAIVNDFVIKTYSNKGEKVVKTKKDTGKKDEDERVKVVRKIVTRFIIACKNKKQMSPSFEDGLRVQELIEIARKGKI